MNKNEDPKPFRSVQTNEKANNHNYNSNKYIQHKFENSTIYPYIIKTVKMKNDNEDGGFEAIEVSPTFFGSSGGGGNLVEKDEGDIEQLPQQDDESTMNDESTIAAASSYISRGYSYVASNTKWVFVMAAAFVVFFSIGIGLGYPIGNSIYGNDDASSVSSAMAVALMGAKSGKSKSDKSSGVSCVEYVRTDFVHMICTNRHFVAKRPLILINNPFMLLLPNIGKSRKGYLTHWITNYEGKNVMPI